MGQVGAAGKDRSDSLRGRSSLCSAVRAGMFEHSMGAEVGGLTAFGCLCRGQV